VAFTGNAVLAVTPGDKLARGWGRAQRLGAWELYNRLKE